jgi:hypothetical protein
MEPFRDPVITPDGNSYERSALVEHLGKVRLLSCQSGLVNCYSCMVLCGDCLQKDHGIFSVLLATVHIVLCTVQDAWLGIMVESVCSSHVEEEWDTEAFLVAGWSI